MPPNSLDHEQQWDAIKQSVEQGLLEALRVDGETQSLIPRAVEIDDRLDRNDIASQKKARLGGKTWGVPVRVRFDLVDPRGQPIRTQTVKVMDLPKLTPRHSFIINGSEYQVRNQFRLRPGVYTRVKRTGELESQFNLMRRFGNFRLRMDPETARYKVQFGTTNVDLLPVLDVLGVTPQQTQEALGPEIWQANLAKVNRERDVRKMYRAIFRKTPDDLEVAVAELREHLLTSRLDPETTNITLGQPFETVTGETVLRAARKILDINRGEAEPDDRDEMRFKRLLTPDDLLRERIVKGSRELTQIKRGLRRRIDQSQDVRVIVQPNRIEDLVHGFFNRSMLAEVPKQINPLEMLSNFAKTTVRGEGGIRERNAVTLEARNLTATQIGFIDPIHTPEGAEIGITNHLAVGVSKEGDRVTTKLIDAASGRPVDIDPITLFESTVAFPDQYELAEGRAVPVAAMVKAMRAGKPVVVSPDEVDYIVATPIGLFDLSVNLLPFLGSLQGGRAMMAAKQQEQAVSLIGREQPLVQVRVGEDSMERIVGKAAQVPLAPVAGTVASVEDERLVIRDAGGELHEVQLYRNFPLNGKSFLESTPLVAEGDVVVEGQPLADSTFTRDGVLALGRNLLTAYLPYKGWNHEDGIVVSETAATKLTSQHLYTKVVPILKNTVLDLEKFRVYFPARFSVAQLGHLDADGIAIKDAVLTRGMPVAAFMVRIEVTPDEAIMGKLGRSLTKPYRDRSLTWDEDVPGQVIEVHKGAKSVQILIRTEEPAVVGDKLSNRAAAKGIITRVVPDNEMPHLEDGTPLEVLLAPTVVPSRINPSQVLELGAAKAAQARGEVFLAEAFRPEAESNIADVQRAMAAAGVNDKELVFDPNTGKPLGQPVAVGPLYALKLDHPVREKFSARGTGPAFGYTGDETPARGEGKSGQSIDHLTLYSLMAHGARANLREMSQIKAGRNDEWWRAWMARDVLPAPKQGVPFERFESLMKAMGINLVRKGNEIQLTPITDREIAALSRGPIRHGRMLMGKNLRPEKGGLFDPDVTGGHGGEGWSHVDLARSIPHPVFEKALTTLLDLKRSDYEDIVSGRTNIDPETGQRVGSGEGLAGGSAIARLLEDIDPKAEIAALEEQAKTARTSRLNRINRKLRFLKNYDELGMVPTDLVLNKIPVIPPRFRPIYPLDSGDLVTNDLNKLYKDLIVINEKLRDLETAGAPQERLVEKARDLYQASKAVMGLATPVTYANSQAMGIFDTIRGRTRNKGGFFQSRILKRRQDLTGRSTLTLDPALHIDEVGVPTEMAWTVFEPMIVRDLVGQGHRPLDAKSEVKQQTDIARQAMDRVVERRLVLINRSPSLHKHSILALRPQLTPGRSITMHPLNLKALGGDVDGDTLALHVPITEPALEEARKLLPSNNIFSISEDLLLAPSQDMQIGLFLMTRGTTEVDAEFDSEAAALRAYRTGDIRVDDIVTVAGTEMTPGRILVNQTLPPALRDPGLVLDKATTHRILSEMARNNAQDAPAVIDKFKDLGRQFSYELGFTIGVNDLQMDLATRDAILAEADAEATRLDPDLDPAAFAERTVAIYQDAQNRLEEAMKEDLIARDNALGLMAQSGARGNWGQVRQIAAAPVLYTDALGRTIPQPVRKSFAEGLDMADYWTSLYGARRGHIEKSVQTAEPGALNKSLIGTTIDMVVTVEDCNTRRGLRVPLNDPRVPGRYLAQPAGPFKAGERLVGDVIARLQREKVDSVVIRSPIYCEDPNGVCQKCWGHDSNGQLIDRGHPVGVMSAQALTEPMTQMSMKTFHTGGVSKRDADLSDNFTKIKQLLELPKTFRGKATLARGAGTITAIEPGIAGGFNVNVDDDPHYVPPGRELRSWVTEGAPVEKGQRLSEGLKDPAELLDLRGPYATREYIAEALDDIYRNSKKHIPARHFETVSRALVNATRVISGDSGFVPGDISSLDAVQAANLEPERITSVPIGDARGAALAELVPDFGELGKILDEDDLIELSAMGYERLQVNPEPVVHQPITKGVTVLPRTRKDWLSHLAFRNLGEVIERGVPEGWKSNIKTQKPLPPYLYGSL